jgi:uncharacterized phage protein (TIGR02216 family)
LGRLRLSPEEFWSMSVFEWNAAIAGLVGPRAAPLERDALKQLMETYPDG